MSWYAINNNGDAQRSRHGAGTSAGRHATHLAGRTVVAWTDWAIRPAAIANTPTTELIAATRFFGVRGLALIRKAVSVSTFSGCDDGHFRNFLPSNGGRVAAVGCQWSVLGMEHPTSTARGSWLLKDFGFSEDWRSGWRSAHYVRAVPWRRLCFSITIAGCRHVRAAMVDRHEAGKPEGTLSAVRGAERSFCLRWIAWGIGS